MLISNLVVHQNWGMGFTVKNDWLHFFFIHFLIINSFPFRFIFHFSRRVKISAGSGGGGGGGGSVYPRLDTATLHTRIIIIGDRYSLLSLLKEKVAL